MSPPCHRFFFYRDWFVRSSACLPFFQADVEQFAAFFRGVYPFKLSVIVDRGSGLVKISEDIEWPASEMVAETVAGYMDYAFRVCRGGGVT